MSYPDGTGRVSVLGWMDKRIGGQLPAGDHLVSITTVGLALTQRTVDGAGLSVGYNRTTYMALGEGACVDLSAPGPCADLAGASKRGSR